MSMHSFHKHLQTAPQTGIWTRLARARREQMGAFRSNFDWFSW
jgi:hypothetical protein